LAPLFLQTRPAKGGDLVKLWHAVLVLVAISAWINYAEHPSARHLKRAVIDTLEL
jgi:hypothetical protein